MRQGSRRRRKEEELLWQEEKPPKYQSAALAGAPHPPKMPQCPPRAQSPALHCCREGKTHSTIPDLPQGRAPAIPVDAEPRIAHTLK